MILAIRQKNIFKILLFAAIVIIGGFIYLRIQGKTLLPSFRSFIEDRVGKSLNAKVSMNSVRLGIFGPTVLKGFCLTKATSEDTPFIFKSEKLIIYYNVAQIIKEKIFKKQASEEKKIVFKIEKGFLYKGPAVLVSNISGWGKILNDNLIFDDFNGKCYNLPISVYGKISGDTSKVDLNINSSSQILRGKAYVSDYICQPHIVATIELKGSRKLYISSDLHIRPGESLALNNLMIQNAILVSGRFDFAKKRFCGTLKRKLAKKTDHEILDAAGLAPLKNVARLSVDFSNKDFLQASVFFDHVVLGDFDLQSQMDLVFAYAGAEGDKFKTIKGNIKTSGSVLNCQPIKELNGEFNIESNVLKISSLKWGDAYNLQGSVDLYRPYKLNLALDIKESSISQLFLMPDVPDADSEGKLKGKIKGSVTMKGSLDDLMTTANLECSKGNLGNLDYESMNINLNGKGSVLKVADSRILRKEGYIVLSGDVDLKRLWSKEPCEGLDWACGNEAVIWEGWDIVKQAKSQELEMKKGIGKEKEFMITFKSYLNDEQSWQDSQGGNQDEAVGVEYSLDEAKRVKMQLKNNEEVFSLENKIKF